MWVGLFSCSCQSHLLYFVLSQPVSIFSVPHHVVCLFDLLLHNPPSFITLRPCFLSRLTSFDADVGAADLAGLVLGSAEVVVVVDVAVVGGGREGVQLEGAICVHVSDVGHVVDVVAGGQVPAQYGTGGAPCWTGQGHPHRAGVGYPLQGGIHKVQPGRAHILTVYCKEDKQTNKTSLRRPRLRSEVGDEPLSCGINNRRTGFIDLKQSVSH